MGSLLLKYFSRLPQGPPGLKQEEQEVSLVVTVFHETRGAWVQASAKSLMKLMNKGFSLCLSNKWEEAEEDPNAPVN